MLFPDPGRERSQMTIPEFLSSLDVDGEKAQLSGILDLVPHINDVILQRFNVQDGLPEIRIVKNGDRDDTQLADLIGTAFFSDSLLTTCLNIDRRANAAHIGMQLPRPFRDQSVAKVSFLWAYSHEVFHYVRRHVLVEKHFGASVETRHALEFDADQCAVAAVYRLAQKDSMGSPFRCKRAVLTNLYWSFREEMDTSAVGLEGSGTHPHAASRLFDVIAKLATLHDTGLPDSSFLSPESHNHFTRLCRVVAQMDAMYEGWAIDLLNGAKPKTGRLTEFALMDSSLLLTGARRKRWDEIAKLMYPFTLMRRESVDNESSIAFLGEVFSIPRSA